MVKRKKMKVKIIILILLCISVFNLYSQESESNNNELNYVGDDYTFKNPFRIYDVDKYYRAGRIRGHL